MKSRLELKALPNPARRIHRSWHHAEEEVNRPGRGQSKGRKFLRFMLRRNSSRRRPSPSRLQCQDLRASMRSLISVTLLALVSLAIPTLAQSPELSKAVKEFVRVQASRVVLTHV